MKNLSGRRIAAHDGDGGFVVEVYFDDKGWQVRYLVVDIGKPMPRREVLVPRAAIAAEQLREDAIRVQLTRAQVEHCPEKQSDPPVWLQHDLRREANYRKAAVSDPHLRSSAIVIGYGLQALDGAIGHLEDLLIERESWLVVQLAIDTRNWLPGRRVLIAPHAVRSIDWVAREMHLNLTRAQVRAAPAVAANFAAMRY